MHNKTLIVGTTPDYIQWIRSSCPGRALFITRPDIRQTAREEHPAPGEEILSPLLDLEEVLGALERHLDQWHQTIDSIFCFDCESMEMGAGIAQRLDLDYPSIQTIRNCRDKYVSKQIWHRHAIGCPRIFPVNSVSDVIDFFKTTRSGCVLKPITGSGSELIFQCTSVSECRSAFNAVKKGLKKRLENPLFQRSSSAAVLMLAEERIVGTEYSCDFIVEKGKIQVIRVARKIKSPFRPFGTILGYVVPATLPRFLGMDRFQQILLNSATSLGIDRGLCMVDFIISDNAVFMIEITPRPGGDCLPHLLKAGTGIDMLKLSLDFAQKRALTLNNAKAVSPHVGIRIQAEEAGILKKIEYSHLLEDKRVKEISLTKKPGHKINLPPEDYDSWNLGHIIIEPSANQFPESQAIAISKKLEIIIETPMVKGT